ncbi:MAG: NAD(P)/FAD-dependent oxidoreductase [Candidatus Coatesbacteria bacterium]|nr:NAD(P)/FAD-dependent oxidoreductase [Candidatus Coatesbacteria bacterium]
MQALIIGAGISGLTIAYRLLKAGFGVKLVERSDRTGGLAASIELGGMGVDRHFHFFCNGEREFRALASELQIEDHLVWGGITRAVQLDRRIHPISTPLDLLKFSPLCFLDRLRFAINVFKGRHFVDIKELDKRTATAWLESSAGRRVYETMWKPLLEAKFGPYATEVSAAWLCARQRMQEERIAYLEGGAAFFAARLAEEVKRLGGELFPSTTVTGIRVENGKVTGVRTTAGELEAELVVSTLPIPLLASLTSGELSDYLKPFSSLKYIGVVSTIILLKRPLVKYFWLNTNDQNIFFAGLIDLTNLDPKRDSKPHVVYVPQYCPVDSQAYSESDNSIRERIMADLPKVNPALRDDWMLDVAVARDCFAQHVCRPGMFERIPPPATPICGFFMTEWAQFYPNDRSLNNSISIANACAGAIIKHTR